MESQAPNRRVVVATDLDGTLLESGSYSFEAAREALEALRARGIPLLLVSSKTRAELETLRQELRVEHPFVVENGGAAYLPPGYFSPPAGKPERSGRYEVVAWGRPYRELVEALRRVREATGAPLEGFSDLDPQRVAALTGLPVAEAALALQREFDEPFRVLGEEDERARRAMELFSSEGLSVTRGGRFYHLMSGCDKGRAVREILRLYRRSGGEWVAAGMGDALNDLPFLEAVDRAYIVAGPDGGHDRNLVEALPAAVRVQPGPQGWSEAVYNFLSWLEERE